MIQYTHAEIFKGSDHAIILLTKKYNMIALVKFPDSDFIQLVIRTTSTSNNLRQLVFENVWETFNNKLIAYISADHLMLTIGKNNYVSSFVFMNKTNDTEIETILAKYTKLPDTREMVYCYKTKDNKYIFVDCLKYYFAYETHRLFEISNNIAKELKIENFDRARDGGTTRITAIDQNTIHELFVPIYKKALYDGEEIIPMSKDESILISTLYESN